MSKIYKRENLIKDVNVKKDAGYVRKKKFLLAFPFRKCYNTSEI